MGRVCLELVYSHLLSSEVPAVDDAREEMACGRFYLAEGRLIIKGLFILKLIWFGSCSGGLNSA